MDMQLIQKYGWTDAIPSLVDPEKAAEALARIVKDAKGILAKVKAPKVEVEGEKVDDPYTARAKQSPDGQKVADEFLRAVAVRILEEFEDSPEIFYHLRHSTVLDATLKDEVEWQISSATRGLPKVSTSDNERAGLAEDYRGAKQFASTLLSLIADADNLTFPSGTVKKGEKGSGLVVDLEPLKGNYGANDGTVATGKYAKTFMVTYLVHNGKEEEPEMFTSPYEAIRAIWPGTSRVGRNTGDLFALVDPVWSKVMAGETVRIPSEPGSDRWDFSVCRRIVEVED